MQIVGVKEDEPTFQLSFRPPAQLAGLACELILDVLIVFAGCANPAAAHLALPDHLVDKIYREM